MRLKVLKEGDYDRLKSRQRRLNKLSKAEILSKALEKGITDIVDTDKLSVHHIDDTKGENGLKNNDLKNLWFIKSTSFKDNDVVHKLIHYMGRNNVSYKELLDRLEEIKLYKYDPDKDEFINKTLKSFKESLMGKRRIIESKSEKDCIEYITLLSKDEAKKLPKAMRKFDGFWWLMDKGSNWRNWDLAASVNEDGSINSYGSRVDILGRVRPKIVVCDDIVSDLQFGDTTNLLGVEWIFIGDNSLMSKEEIGYSKFNERASSVSNTYEGSQIQKYLQDWLNGKLSKNESLTESAHDTVEQTYEYRINKRTEGRNGETEVYTVQVSDESKTNRNDWFKAGNWYEVLIDFDTKDQARKYVKSLGISLKENVNEAYIGHEVMFCPKCAECDDIKYIGQDKIKCKKCGYEGDCTYFFIDGHFTTSDAKKRILGDSLKEEIEKQPDTTYKGITIEHFPLTWKMTDDGEPFDQDGYVIKSPYYLQSNENKDKYYLPLYCEDPSGKVLNFDTLDDAKKYIDDYIVPKKGKIHIKYGDEVHFELLPEFRADDYFEESVKRSCRSLKEDVTKVEIIPDKPEQKEGQGDVEVGASALFMDMINQEYALLSQYESMQVTLEDHGEQRFNEIIDYIKDDINIHIGMLQAGLEDLNPSAEKVDLGKDQAEELLTLDESWFK